MKPFTNFRSRTVVLPAADIDTDQIIPARFLTTTSRAGLGAHLFSDWRFDRDGKERSAFVLNTPKAKGARVLVAGHNFGCGSSREHAPWALLDYGFRAIISTGIADIFRSNALKNGLLPIEVPVDVHAFLLANPDSTVEVDLHETQLKLDNGTAINFSVEAFARTCLLQGIDALGYLQSKESSIREFEEARA